MSDAKLLADAVEPKLCGTCHGFGDVRNEPCPKCLGKRWVLRELSHEERKQIAEFIRAQAGDALRWRALLASGHLRMMGWAGFDQDGRPVKKHLHFGMEAWSHPHAGVSAAAAEESLKAERKRAETVLINFVESVLVNKGGAV